MNDLKQLAAVTAINNMLQQGWISICTINTIGSMLGIDPKRGGESYKILETLHCVNLSKMPPELVNSVPRLIMECLAVEPTFQFQQPKQVARAIEPEPAEAQSGRRKLLGIF